MGVAMQARGGAEGLEVEDPQLYIVVMCVLFGASVLANSNGFSAPGEREAHADFSAWMGVRGCRSVSDSGPSMVYSVFGPQRRLGSELVSGSFATLRRGATDFIMI